MPYKNPKQATAVFMSIARKQGMDAAKVFGRKHREDLSRGARAAKPYKPRKKS